jgi:putative component of toxin-antitoxin plasmid stabilization module
MGVVISAPQFPGRGVDGADGGGHDGGMEARIARLESAAEHMQGDLRDIKADIRDLRTDARTDFRLLFGALIAVALGLTGVMAKGFGWL